MQRENAIAKQGVIVTRASEQIVSEHYPELVAFASGIWNFTLFVHIRKLWNNSSHLIDLVEDANATRVDSRHLCEF